MSGEMSRDEELAYLKTKVVELEAKVAGQETQIACQETQIACQNIVIATLKNTCVLAGNTMAIQDDTYQSKPKPKPKKESNQKKKSNQKKPSQKKVHTPKKESISCEANLKSLLDTKVPTLLANIPRDYKVTFGDSHPLEKPIGKYLEGFDFISLDTSEQTDGTGPVWVSLTTTSD
jgi:uncharacterized coiled-coil protein SlyX